MFISYFPNNCGHIADTTNSHVEHVISSSSSYIGPYRKLSQIAPEWSHEPFITRGPNNEYVLYYSYANNLPYFPISY